MTSVLSTINPLYEKFQTLTRSIYSDLNTGGQAVGASNQITSPDGAHTMGFNSSDNSIVNFTTNELSSMSINTTTGAVNANIVKVAAPVEEQELSDTNAVTVEYVRQHTIDPEDYVKETELPTKLAPYLTKEEASATYQVMGEYMTEEEADEKYAPNDDYLTQDEADERYALKGEVIPPDIIPDANQSLDWSSDWDAVPVIGHSTLISGILDRIYFSNAISSTIRNSYFDIDLDIYFKNSHEAGPMDRAAALHDWIPAHINNLWVDIYYVNAGYVGERVGSAHFDQVTFENSPDNTYAYRLHAKSLVPVTINACDGLQFNLTVDYVEDSTFPTGADIIFYQCAGELKISWEDYTNVTIASRGHVQDVKAAIVAAADAKYLTQQSYNDLRKVAWDDAALKFYSREAVTDSWTNKITIFPSFTAGNSFITVGAIYLNSTGSSSSDNYVSSILTSSRSTASTSDHAIATGGYVNKFYLAKTDTAANAEKLEWESSDNHITTLFEDINGNLGLKWDATSKIVFVSRNGNILCVNVYPNAIVFGNTSVGQETGKWEGVIKNIVNDANKTTADSISDSAKDTCVPSYKVLQDNYYPKSYVDALEARIAALEART